MLSKYKILFEGYRVRKRTEPTTASQLIKCTGKKMLLTVGRHVDYVLLVCEAHTEVPSPLGGRVCYEPLSMIS
jgi:hypothetical protein